MFLVELFKWWYGFGWLDAWKRVGGSAQKTGRQFSIPVLLKNLFAPWKQIVSLPGRSLDDKFRAMVDNLVSRTIGFFVRMLTLIAAMVVICLSAALSLALAVVWPLLPPAAVYFLVRAVAG
ncbi:MAG TPA: hypothetical protein VFW52_02805 [Candidatus Saccharimonadales bacterium]|nr:hypothetical protein [Candidatus Saccharimonadales bacterium]